MLSALFSFLGGSAFRMIWGEASAYFNKKQDHQHEKEMLTLQSDLEDKAHQRQLESLRLQNEMGVKMVEIQRDAAVATEEAKAFTEAMKEAFKPTGIFWIDAWNGTIRPQFAQLALVLWFLKLAAQNFVMDEWDMGLVAGVLGYFIADRSLGKRNK